MLLLPAAGRITLPDDTVKEGKKLITTPMEIAASISQGLANNALISKVHTGS